MAKGKHPYINFDSYQVNRDSQPHRCSKYFAQGCADLFRPPSHIRFDNRVLIWVRPVKVRRTVGIKIDGWPLPAAVDVRNLSALPRSIIATDLGDNSGHCGHDQSCCDNRGHLVLVSKYACCNLMREETKDVHKTIHATSTPDVGRFVVS